MTEINSRLGYIMSLLGLTGKTIALEIGIDMTTVSKWKNGQRKLKLRSKYTDELAKYFLSEAFTYQKNQLMALLSTSGVDTTSLTDEQQVEAMKVWLTEDSKLYALTETPPSEEEKVTVQMYKGYEGWKKSMEIFWNRVLSLPSGQNVTLGDFGDIKWDLVDQNMLKDMINYMLKAISMGHKLTIIDYMTNEYKPYVVILRWLKVYLSQNVEVRYIYKQDEAYFNEAIYCIDGNLAIVGMSIEKDHSDHITMIYEDKTSIDFYQKAIQTFYNKSERLILTTDIKDPSNILKVMEENFNEKQTTYMINPMPTFRNMPVDLLERILKDNDVPNHLQDLCIDANRRRKALRNRCKYVQIYDLDALEEAVTKQFIVDYDLSIIVGKEVRIKQHFFREHLEYLTSVSNSENYTMVLVSFESLKLNVEKTSICVQDDSIVIAWHPERYERAIYCKELTVIGGYFQYLKDLWHQIPPISKSDPWRQKQLNRLLER